MMTKRSTLLQIVRYDVKRRSDVQKFVIRAYSHQRRAFFSAAENICLCIIIIIMFDFVCDRLGSPSDLVKSWGGGV